MKTCTRVYRVAQTTFRFIIESYSKPLIRLDFSSYLSTKEALEVGKKICAWPNLWRHQLLFEAAIGKLSVHDKRVIENLKKENGNKINFCMRFHRKDGLGVELTAYESEMTKEGAMTLLYVTWRSFAPHADLLTSQITVTQSRIEYLIPSDYCYYYSWLTV